MSSPATASRTATSCHIAPCRDDAQLRAYIDQHWRAGHVLARDERMFNFTYRTPWVDRAHFPSGTSVLCIYDDDGEHGPKGQLLGFLGTIVASYPRPTSYWLALWHVLPSLKGTGLGGKLLAQMQSHAESADGWIGTFGAGPEAVPVYLKRGYAVRAVRRWIFDPKGLAEAGERPWTRPTPPAITEHQPDDAWLAHRYDDHPILAYERSPAGVFRTETNAWGVVTHACRITDGVTDGLRCVWERGRRLADVAGVPHLMDAWDFDCPGPGWALATKDLPSVFHPPAARGNLIHAAGRPFLPSIVTKGDCDQDRPN
ncbi:MAG: GNAT family N-acetyltransferase [Phycisphaerales bacterium]